MKTFKWFLNDFWSCVRTIGRHDPLHTIFGFASKFATARGKICNYMATSMDSRERMRLLSEAKQKLNAQKPNTFYSPNDRQISTEMWTNGKKLHNSFPLKKKSQLVEFDMIWTFNPRHARQVIRTYVHYAADVDQSQLTRARDLQARVRGLLHRHLRNPYLVS